MDKILERVPKITIIFGILAVIFFVWGTDQGKIANSIQLDLTKVDSCEIIPENEGIPILVNGRINVVNAPVDRATGITCNGLLLVRNVEMYQYYISGDEVYKGFKGYQVSDISGKHKEKYNNPDFPEDFKREIYIATATIGDNGMVIDENYLSAIYKGASFIESPAEAKILDNIDLPGFVSCGDGYYTNADPDDFKIGDIRVRYEYIEPQQNQEYTISGVQNGDMITYDEAAFSGIADKVLDVNEYAKSQGTEHTKSRKNFYIAAGALGGIGILALAICLPKREED